MDKKNKKRQKDSPEITRKKLKFEDEFKNLNPKESINDSSIKKILENVEKMKEAYEKTLNQMEKKCNQLNEKDKEKDQKLQKLQSNKTELQKENELLKKKLKKEYEKQQQNNELIMQDFRDRISFYETITHLKIESSTLEEQIYQCKLSDGNSYSLTFTLSPHTEEGKIQYKPGEYKKKNENGEILNQEHPEFLGHTIAFEEIKIPSFLMRIHKYIEGDVTKK
eukprot:gene6347-10354_t